MDWQQHRGHWPHSELSQFVSAAGVTWHVQQAGSRGPRILLLHGTGASGHTWRDSLLPLAEHARVLSLDLPGHAFSSLSLGQGMSLPGMARGIAQLLDQMNWPVDVFIGHSAGAAIAAQMVVALGFRPQLLMGINPAWLPLPGLAGLLFPTAAKLLALSPLVPQWFAQRASHPGTIDKMLEGTGSALDERGQALYSELVASPAHAQGALKMMAAWDLSSGADSLRQLRCPVRILVGENDGTVPPTQADQAMRLMPQATLLRWPGLGHLLHEEQPQRFVEDVMTSLRGV